MKHLMVAISMVGFGVAGANAQGFVDFDGTETGLVGYTNDVITSFTGAGLGTDAAELETEATTDWGPGDAFFPMSRAVTNPTGVGMPFGISDDSVAAAAGNSVFATDESGFAGQAKTDGFFGVIDTVNGDNPDGAAVATFTFDVAGLSNISVSADFAAMGDFEDSDTFIFEYSFDGTNFSDLFVSSVDTAGSQNYLMDSGQGVTLDDPVAINGTFLDDEFQTLSAPVTGAGSELTIRFTAEADGGSEGFGFDNLTVVPEPASLVTLALGLLMIRRR